MVTARRMAIATITGIRTRMADVFRFFFKGVIPASEPGSTRTSSCRSLGAIQAAALRTSGSPLKAGMTRVETPVAGERQ